MSFSPDAPGERAAELSAAGWSIFVDHTYVVDLRSTIPVAQDQGATMPFVPSGHRRRVRRALAKGVVAQRVDRVDELLLTVMRQAFSAHGGQSRWTHDQLDRVNRLLDRGDAVALEAVHQDRRLGVVVRLRGGDRAFSWIGAVLPEGRPLAAATVLAHEHMRLAAAEGVLHFDLLGHVDDGVASFKRSMGGEERTFVEGTDSALLLAAARSAVFRLRALRAAVLSRRGSHAEPAASVGSITSGTAES